MNPRAKFSIIILVLFMVIGGAVRPADALIDTHECSTCHFFHGAISNAGLLKNSSTEALCLSCHSVVQGSADAASVHNPANLASNQQGYITCRECHNPHDNIDGNIKLVGYKFDPSTNQRFNTAVIREELTTSDPASPVYKDVVFANNTTEPLDYYRSSASGANGICQACHSNNHLIGKDCISCHNHREDFANADPLDDEGFPATDDCTYCHNGTGTDGAGYKYEAYNVGPASPHVKINGSTPFNACTDCHPSHTQTPDVVVPNNALVEILYTANGESGFGLGGTKTTGTTEAEICWNCHRAGQSEWNASPYNLNDGTGTAVENWTASGAEFSTDSASLIPDRSVRSIHTANTLKAGVSSVDEYLNHADRKNLESVADIRCSYCHDVHDLNLAAGDNESGPPYLRGSWMSNPYPFDMPPQSGDVYTQNRWGTWMTFTTPRLLSTSTGSMTGKGYFIDQNSDWPTHVSGTTYYTASQTSGLCLLCHGDGTTDTQKVDGMDWYTTSLWAGAGNGHANSVLSGTGAGSSNASNIFNGTRGDVCVPVYMGAQGAYWIKNQSAPPDPDGFRFGVRSFNPTQWDVDNEWDSCGGIEADNDAPFNGDDTGQPGDGWSARAALPQNNSGWYGGTAGDAGNVPSQWNAWFGTLNNGIGTAGSNGSPRAHNFTCSKCHNPHASGLPALLETNCLDVALSTWGGSNRGVDYGPKAASTWGQRVASNCHRKDNTGSIQSDGWNTLSPGI